MPINLEKGGIVELASASPTLKVAGIGLGWDPKSEQAGFLGKLFGATDAEYDLDASVFVLGRNGKLLADNWFVFFNNKRSPNGAVVHGGDNITGQGDGDDEAVTVDFDKLPADAQTVSVWVTIYKAKERKQGFSEVENSFVRLYDAAAKGGTTLLRYDLNHKMTKSETAVEFCRLDRTPAGWTFRAVGEGHHMEIGDVLAKFS
jgi:tellurium resistance protein TerD